MKRLITILALLQTFSLQAIYGPESKAHEKFAKEVNDLIAKISQFAFDSNGSLLSAKFAELDKTLEKKFSDAVKTSAARKIFRFENTASIAVIDALEILPRNSAARKAAIEFLWLLVRHDRHLAGYRADVDSLENAQRYVCTLMGIDSFHSMLPKVFAVFSEVVEDGEMPAMSAAFYLLSALCNDENALSKLRSSEDLQTKVENLLQILPKELHLYSQGQHFLQTLSESAFDEILPLVEEKDSSSAKRFKCDEDSSEDVL